MNNTTYTLIRLLSEYNIVIPLIQRDYAHGRNDTKTIDIRKNILESIASALEIHGTPLDFDFIFGRVEEMSPKKRMLPIDGQQRLTTLFLIHWYVAFKEDRLGNISDILSRFSYKIRPGAERFIRLLASTKPEFTLKEGKLSSDIANESWFCEQWQDDPSVKGMLIMLDAIHNRFYLMNSLWETLIVQERITFQFRVMEDLGLDDDIYIKMNSRGKPLTEFENFKARFEKFLEINHPEFRNEFSQKIDGPWCDFFWEYRNNDYLIDNAFMNFFHFLTELLYHKETNGYFRGKYIRYSQLANQSYSWEVIEQVYISKECLRTLFKLLDSLTKRATVNEYFNSLISGSTFIQGRVTLFMEEYNLLEKCIYGELLSGSNQLLLYFLLINLADRPSKLNKEEIARKIRVLRNLLLQERQFQWPHYREEFRFQNMQNYIASVEQLHQTEQDIYVALMNGITFKAFKDDAIEHEREKAKIIVDTPIHAVDIWQLEDLPVFKGNIKLILSSFNTDEYQNVIKIIQHLFLSGNAIFTIQGMIAKGFYGHSCESCALGDRWFFGHENNWEAFFTRPNFDLPIEFFSHFIQTEQSQLANELLSLIVNTRKKVTDKSSWEYYFLNYPEFLSRGSNLFAWRHDDDAFDIERISKWQAKSWHINPYIDAVISIVGKDKIEINGCASKNEDASRLLLNNGITLWCEKIGWRVQHPIELPSCIMDHVRLAGNKYYLKEHQDKDRIQLAAYFINELCPHIAKVGDGDNPNETEVLSHDL